MTNQFNPGKHNYQPSRIHAGCGVSWPVYAGGGQFRCCGKPEVSAVHYMTANVHDNAITSMKGSIARYEAGHDKYVKFVGHSCSPTCECHVLSMRYYLPIEDDEHRKAVEAMAADDNGWYAEELLPHEITSIMETRHGDRGIPELERRLPVWRRVMRWVRGIRP